MWRLPPAVAESSGQSLATRSWRLRCRNNDDVYAQKELGASPLADWIDFVEFSGWLLRQLYEHSNGLPDCDGKCELAGPRKQHECAIHQQFPVTLIVLRQQYVHYPRNVWQSAAVSLAGVGHKLGCGERQQ